MITDVDLIKAQTNNNIIFWNDGGKPAQHTGNTTTGNVIKKCWGMKTSYADNMAKFLPDNSGSDGYFIDIRDDCVTITPPTGTGVIIATNKLSGCTFSIYYNKEAQLYVGAHVYRGGGGKTTETAVEEYAKANNLIPIKSWCTAGCIDGTVKECWGIAFLRGNGAIKLVGLGIASNGKVQKLLVNSDFSCS